MLTSKQSERQKYGERAALQWKWKICDIQDTSFNENPSVFSDAKWQNAAQ